MTESEVAEQCDKLARDLGWEVESYSDTRKVRTCPGLPDRRYVQRARGHRVWVELKGTSGPTVREQCKLTRQQHRWLLAELAAGGLATCLDSPEQLRRLLSLLSRDAGRGEALRLCGEWLALQASKGYRGEAKGAA